MSDNNLAANLILNLKEELLFDIRETENKIIDRVNKKWCQIESTNNSLLDKINLMMENNKQMFESITLQKMKLDKISDYEPFKNKIESMVTTHEIRINSVLNDLYTARAKYDKIFSDNLSVPGFIGPSCQYKTISDYLMSQIMEISRMKSEREQLKSDVKECKNRFDGFLKNMVILSDNSVSRCNQYTDNKEKIIKEFVENNFDNFDKKLLDVRAGIYDNQQKMFEEIKEYMKEFDGLLELKNDIDKALNKKFKEKEKIIEKLNKEIEEKGKEISNIVNDYKQFNKALNDINLSLKEIQFRETTNQMDIIRINAKLKRNEFVNINLEKKNSNNLNNNNLNNNNQNHDNKNNVINIDIFNKKNSINEESFKIENTSPTRNNKIPNEGIKMFKESLKIGKTLLNRKNTDYLKDSIIYLKKKESKKSILLYKGKEKEKPKENEKEKPKENEQKENMNKIYEQIPFRRYVTSNEISYTITNNDFNNNNNQNNNNDFSISSIKNRILKNSIIKTDNNINKDTIEVNKKNSFKRNSKSEYKSKKINQKYSNLLKDNNNNNIQNIKQSLNNYKTAKFNIVPIESSKRYKTLYNDGFITSSPKVSKGFNINTLTQKKINNIFHNSNKNIFNYKIIKIGDKISLDNELNDIYPLDFETLKKRSIKINMTSPLSDTLKNYQNEKNKQNQNKELNIKVSPAFGSTVYSFYNKNSFPNINNKNS